MNVEGNLATDVVQLYADCAPNQDNRLSCSHMRSLRSEPIRKARYDR